MNDSVIPLVVDALREAGAAWAARPVPERLRPIRAMRRAIARNPVPLAATLPRPAADTLVAEILPLLDAARFLEREAAGLLRPRRPVGRRPLWLLGTRARVHRVPLGAVLVLAPGNYPVFLPGAQALGALAAGNAVAWKPAPGGEAAAEAVRTALVAGGLPPELLRVLPADSGPAAVAAGFDHILLTGSAETGRTVARTAADTLTPCTMELSGSDAVFVLPGADLPLVARALLYGLRLNGGATCIAPRRVFATPGDAAALETLLLPELPGLADAAVPPGVAGTLAGLLAEAAGQGARVHHPGPGRPALVADARPEMSLLGRDVFAPWLALVPVADMAAALEADRLCPYALGASVWGPAAAARAFAGRVRAFSVCVNDLIVPTADPRLSFGGGGRSGWGRTRGAEGLLAMTATRTVSERVLPFRPHLAPPGPADETRFTGMIRFLHAPWFPKP